MIYILIVGLIAGWATGKLMKGSGYGVLVDILLGIVGAFVGSRVLGMLGIYTGGGLDIFMTGSGNVINVTDSVITGNENVNSYGGGVNVDSSDPGLSSRTSNGPTNA